MRRLALVVVAFALTGCPPAAKPGRTKILEDVPLGNGQRGVATARTQNPHGPAGPLMNGGPAKPSEQGVELPLVLEGQNSKAQLARERALLQDEQVAAKFERAFRLTFTTERAARSPSEARALFQQVLAARAKFAPALRGIGYTFVDDGFQIDEAVRSYREAIAADEGYGPAHYGLAFLLASSDLETGRKHFERAMALGVEDERKLGEKFYHR